MCVRLLQPMIPTTDQPRAILFACFGTPNAFVEPGQGQRSWCWGPNCPLECPVSMRDDFASILCIAHQSCEPDQARCFAAVRSSSNTEVIEGVRRTVCEYGVARTVVIHCFHRRGCCLEPHQENCECNKQYYCLVDVFSATRAQPPVSFLKNIHTTRADALDDMSDTHVNIWLRWWLLGTTKRQVPREND